MENLFAYGSLREEVQKTVLDEYQKEFQKNY
jgi:hypothetical protein